MNIELFFNSLKKNDVDFFAGVPDSLLKSFCSYISDLKLEHNYTTACEGGAMAMAIGYHLNTDKVPCVFMQNSGLGNIINPLLSLADEQVYGIPMLMIIGWRGEVDKDGIQIKDEPQHKKQGLVTLELLDTMGVEHQVIDDKTTNVESVISSLIISAKRERKPVAIVVRKNTFENYKAQLPYKNSYKVKREDAIQTVVESLHSESKIIATTGMISRELFELRVKNNQSHEHDFLTVGGMGFASQITAGFACENSSNSVICLDGDGAFLMHMGSLAINSNFNIIHIVLNNEVHDSVGGQPTSACNIDIPAIALACGYSFAKSVESIDALRSVLAESELKEGARLIEIKVAMGARSNLGRPTLSSKSMKNLFMPSNME